MSLASGNSMVNVTNSVADSKGRSEVMLGPEEDGGDDDLDAAVSNARSNGLEERLNEKISEV